MAVVYLATNENLLVADGRDVLEPILASTKIYGTPYAACMAQLMEASGVTRNLPDLQHIASFTRSNGSVPSTTVLGAACSFLDSGFNVMYAGPLDAEAVRKRPDEIKTWQNRFIAGRSADTFSLRTPNRRKIAALVGGSRMERWLTILFADARALGSGETGVQPVVVNELCADGQTLMIHDPGSALHEASTNRPLNITQALGGRVVNSRVSLLAVRRRPATIDGVQLSTVPVAGCTYNN
jgi:hypothetical protein